MFTKKNYCVIIYTKIFVDPQKVYVQNIYVYEITLLKISSIIWSAHNNNVLSTQR